MNKRSELRVRNDPKEIEELTAAHKPFWEKLKRVHGINSQEGLGRVTDIPGFAESLNNLINVNGYSMTDVAVMLGVSRERVRQWLKNLGITPHKHGTRPRLWSDAESRFVSVPYGRCYRIMSGSASRIRNKKQEKERKLKTDIEAIRDYVKKHGVVPYPVQVWPKHTELMAARHRWGVNWIADMERLWKEAGYVLPDGRRGAWRKA